MWSTNWEPQGEAIFTISEICFRSQTTSYSFDISLHALLFFWSFCDRSSCSSKNCIYSDSSAKAFGACTLVCMLDDHSDATKMSTYVSSGNRPITIHHRRSIRMQQPFLLPNSFAEALFLLQLDNVKRISCRHSASVELKPIPK